MANVSFIKGHVSPSRDATHFVGPLIALAVLEATWTISLWSGSYSEFTSHDTLMLALHMVLVVALQIAVVALLSLALRAFTFRDPVVVVVASALCTFAFYGLILAFIDSFASASTLYKTVTTFIVFLICVALLSAALRPWGLVFVVTMAGIVSISSLGELAFAAVSEQREYNSKSLPSTFRSIEFPVRPNVYLISFDALLPSNVAKGLLGLEEVPPHVTIAKRLDLRVLRNTFADSVPTTNSINSMLSFDTTWWDTLGQDRTLLDTGERPSPLYKIFKDNGYSIQFFYKNTFFGPPAKARLDYYGVANGGICTNVDRQWTLMGFCMPWIEDWWRAHVGFHKLGYPQLVFDRIVQTARSPEPWLTVAYIYAPGHTEKSFSIRRDSLDPYRKSYWKGSEQAAEYIATLVRLIKQHDPDGVLVIFGDHGAYISRGLSPDDPHPLTKMDVIRDRHAVFAGLYPKSFCEEELSNAGEPLGTVRLMRLIVKCLAGGVDPMTSVGSDDDSFAGYEYE
jgi:sulfatase-like protein